jgi:hypothetical protein
VILSFVVTKQKMLEDFFKKKDGVRERAGVEG